MRSCTIRQASMSTRSTDAAGRIFFNIEDTEQLGALDAVHKRLFSVCANAVMVATDALSGKHVADRRRTASPRAHHRRHLRSAGARPLGAHATDYLRARPVAAKHASKSARPAISSTSKVSLRCQFGYS